MQDFRVLGGSTFSSFPPRVKSSPRRGVTRLLLIIVRLLAARALSQKDFLFTLGRLRAFTCAHARNTYDFSLEHAFVGTVTCTCPGYHSHANARRKDCLAALCVPTRDELGIIIPSICSRANERLKRRGEKGGRTIFEENEIRDARSAMSRDPSVCAQEDYTERKILPAVVSFHLEGARPESRN